MRFAAVLVSVVALSLAAGCGTRTAPAAIPTTSSADIASDPSWTPPNEDGFVIVEKPEAQSEKKSAGPSAVMLPAPNGSEQPRGAVHAATN